MRGRGGAAFPFAHQAAHGRRRAARPVVVVNLSEGEPASAKDSALSMTRPHLILDGAVVTARALGAREPPGRVPGDRPSVGRSRCRDALAERARRRCGSTSTRPEPASSQDRPGPCSSCIAGRAQPAGHGLAARGRLRAPWPPDPALERRDLGAGRRGSSLERRGRLSPARHGRGAGHHPDDRHHRPGARRRRGGLRHAVVEDVLPTTVHGRPVLLGGFHGSWAPWSGPLPAPCRSTG